MSYVSNEPYSKDAYNRIHDLGNKLNQLLFNLNKWEQDEYLKIPNLIKHKSYILLSSLILCKDFKWPNAINPTLRETIQFEWEIYFNNGDNYYFELEVFENKIGLMLAWRNLLEDEKTGFTKENYFDYEFLDEDGYYSFPINIHMFLEKGRVTKDKYILKILELFTMKVEKDN